MSQLPLPPRLLDGADVVLWAVSQRGLFHTIPHGSDSTADGVISVPAMAICRYSDDDRYYLFKCDESWTVVFDWDAETVAEAQQMAASQVKDQPIEWQAYPPSQV